MDPSTLAQYGPWGLLAALLPVIGKLWQRNNEVQDARLTDHKAHTDQVVGLQKEHTGQLMANNETLRRALDVVEGRPDV